MVSGRVTCTYSTVCNEIVVVTGCVYAPGQCVLNHQTVVLFLIAVLTSHKSWLLLCTDDDFERELQLALEISRQEAMESGVLQLEDGDYCVESTEA